MTTSRMLAITIASFGLTCPTANAQEKTPEPPAIKIGVGKPAPFHVADFVSGPYKGHPGCPSVISKNKKAKSILVWAITTDEPTLALAKDLDAVQAPAVLNFFVLWNRSASEETLVKAMMPVNLKNTIAGLGRMSYKEPELTYHFGLDFKVTTLVALLDGDNVRSLWMLSANENTPKMRKTIAEEAVKFVK